MTITAENLNLDAITLADGTELIDPPQVTNAEGDVIDREATAEMHNAVTEWAEVAYRIAGEAHGTKPTVSTEDGKNLRKAYADLPVRAKAYARGFAEDRMREALIKGGDDADAFTLAIIWNAIAGVQKEGADKPKAERKAKVTVSPTELAAEKLAVLRMASEYLVSNPDDDVEEDVDEQAEAKVEDLYGELETYLDWETRELDEGEEKGEFEGELSPLVKEAARLVLKKGRRAGGGGGSRVPFTGTRRSPVAHIENAFETVNSGDFLTIAEIVAIPSPEYGDDKPSSGAVAARLFPKNGSECSVEGIEAGTNSDGRQGARKL